MTNTGVTVPNDIQKRLAEARDLAHRVALVERYIAECELSILAPDEAFAGADLVLLRDDYLLCFEVMDWRAARVRLTLTRMVEDGDGFETVDLWSIELTEVPWEVFARVLAASIKGFPNTGA